MKVSFIVPCRNKASHVAKTVDTVLSQTYSPMEIILSDQGSIDDTLGILKARAKSYTGPNLVRVLSCPDHEFIGRAGMNRHIWWIIQQTDADLIMMCAADDLNHKDRALHTVAAYENAYLEHPGWKAAVELAKAGRGNLPNPDDFRPSHIGTRMRFIEPDGTPVGETVFPERRSRFIGQAECFRHLIGSSSSPAWTRPMWEKYGPLGPCESDDMIWPYLSLFEKGGFYYVDKPLFTYVRHASLDNTGLEGVTRATEDNSPERLQAIETQNYHMVSHWTNVWRRLEVNGLINRLDGEAMGELVRHITQCANNWAIVRDELTVRRIPPINMKV